jgi:hypothetical protein
MFNYEALKERQQSTVYDTIPTGAELGGNFQGLPAVYDPATTTQVGTDASGNPIYSRQQFSCNGVLNVICPNRIDPLMASYAAVWYPSLTQGGANNYINNSPSPLNMYQLTGRIDHKISDKLQFFARYSMQTGTDFVPTGLPENPLFVYNGYKNAVASWTYLVNPTTVADFKLGFHRDNLQQDYQEAPGAVSWTNSHPMTGVGIRSLSFPTYPGFEPTGFTGPNTTATPLLNNSFEGNGNISKVMGRHSIEAGFHILHQNGYSDGIYNTDLYFSSVPTADPANVANTGSSLASYLLGLPSSGTNQEGDTAAYLSWSDDSFYVQDNIKVTKKFTLDLGLRYEYIGVPVEKFNHLSDFDTDLNAYVWAGKNPVTGQGPNVRRSIVATDWDGWAPRFGFAYQVIPRTTLRGGYGIFFAPTNVWNSQGPRGGWPYGIGESDSGTNTVLPNLPVETYWPDYTTPQPGTPPSSAWAERQHQKNSYVQQWNVGIQQQFMRNVLLEVDYIGNHGLHITCEGCQANPPLPGPGVVGTPEHPRAHPLAGFLNGLNNIGATDYDALQAKFEKRFSNGFSFLATYAWSHQMSVVADAYAGGFSYGAQNPFDAWADWGNGAFDYHQILTLSYIYQLPLGNGKRWLANANPVAKQALGGWTVSGITHYNSGPPVNIGIPIDNANDESPQRPDFIPGFPARVISTSDRTQGWLNPASYVVAPEYTFGNLGHNSARGPGFGNWDMGLFKDFDIHEGRQYFQFRVEGFNIFNIVDFSSPASTINVPGFGDITSTTQPAREIQLALKFIF